MENAQNPELMAKAEGYANVEDYLDYHHAAQLIESIKEWISSEELERKIGL